MNPFPSRHNIISEIEPDKEYLIVNILSGNADFISGHEYKILKDSRGGYPSEFFKKGYVTDPSTEELNYRLRYIDFLENRDKEEIQLFFVPSYQCNFNCSYCYQSDYPSLKNHLSTEIIDKFFNFILEQFSGSQFYITLFGGEPLLAGKKHFELIEYFINKATTFNITLAIVTNGFTLNQYLPLLNKKIIREVQVTLDGTSEIHNSRRSEKSGMPTFERIAKNIDLCLDAEIPVNLRMVVDGDNIENLPCLAQFAIEKGWTRNPGFKTQLGRNYELHYCQNGPGKLLSRLELYQQVYRLIKANPHIVEFHKPAFSAMRFLSENGKLPDPIFDACPACKSEWAFDHTGTIYSCTATVGKPDEKLGTFYPDIKLEKDKIELWQLRDVLHIEKCRDCNLQLLCGGGCGSIAKNQLGNIFAPDCRPLEELHSLGAKIYFSH